MRSKHTNGGEGHEPDADKAGRQLSSPPPESDEGLVSSAKKARRHLPSSPPVLNSNDGHRVRADKAVSGLSSLLPESDDGPTTPADKAFQAMPSSPSQSSEGHAAHADKASYVVPSLPSDIEQTVARIRYWHRQRVYAMEQRKRADLSLLAFLRTALGWSKALPDAERAEIKKQAMALVAVGEAKAKGKKADTDEPWAYVEWHDIIGASLAARAPFDVIEGRACARMEKLAKTLPIYSWAKVIRGLKKGGSFAVIVAEAGDLANYATHSKLWKRMGVAVMGDVRQGGLAKNASKDDWIAHGYNRQRRSRLWNIGDAMIKAQVRKVLDADGEDTGERTSIGDYGATYLARKTYELVRDPEMAPMKAHRRAQRYMEKRLLRNLWRAWRDERKANGGVPETAIVRLPSAQQNEEMAVHAAPSMAVELLPSPRQIEQPAPGTLPEKALLQLLAVQ